MMDAAHPVDQPEQPPPPPRPDDAHHMVADRVFPELSRDQPMIIQMPTFQDLPRPRLRGTETSQQD